MRMEATLEKWQELYDLTLEIKKAEPWKYLGDTDIIRILLPNETEPYFISILGKNKDTYGIVVYPGYESFNSFVLLSNSERLGIPGLYAMYEQDNLTCYFGDRNEVSSKQYKVIRELGLRFRGKNQWPFFLSFKPNYTPYIVDEDEVQKLVNVYRELIPLIELFASKQINVNFSQDETVTRYYDQKEKSWKYEVSELEYMEKSYVTLNLDSNHPMIKELRSQPKNKSTIEIDINYSRMTIDGKDEGFDRPVSPKLLIIIDQNSGMVISQEMILPDTNEEDMILNLLFNYIEKYSLPKAIHFRLPHIGFLLKSLCSKIQVSLIHNKQLSMSDEFFNDFFKFFDK